MPILAPASGASPTELARDLQQRPCEPTGERGDLEMCSRSVGTGVVPRIGRHYSVDPAGAWNLDSLEKAAQRSFSPRRCGSCCPTHTPRIRTRATIGLAPSEAAMGKGDNAACRDPEDDVYSIIAICLLPFDSLPSATCHCRIRKPATKLSAGRPPDAWDGPCNVAGHDLASGSGTHWNRVAQEA